MRARLPLAIFYALLSATGCARNDRPAPPADAEPSPPVPAVMFTDVTAAAGLRFTHVNGAAGRKLLRDMYLHGVHFAAATPASLVFLSEISSPKRRSITMLPEHVFEHQALVEETVHSTSPIAARPKARAAGK